MDLRMFSVLLFVPALLLAQVRPNVPAVTEEVQFLFFFRRLAPGEATVKADGASDSPEKRALKDTAGLTDTEISRVLEVALELQGRLRCEDS